MTHSLFHRIRDYFFFSSRRKDGPPSISTRSSPHPRGRFLFVFKPVQQSPIGILSPLRAAGDTINAVASLDGTRAPHGR